MIIKKNIISLKDACKQFKFLDYDVIDFVSMFDVDAYHIKINNKVVPLNKLNIIARMLDDISYCTDEYMVYYSGSENKINKLLCLEDDGVKTLSPRSDTFMLIYYKKKDKWKVRFKNDWGQIFDVCSKEIEGLNQLLWQDEKLVKHLPFINKSDNDAKIKSSILACLQTYKSTKCLAKKVPYDGIFLISSAVKKSLKSLTAFFKAKQNKPNVDFIEFIKTKCNTLRNTLKGNTIEALKNFQDGKLSHQLCISLLTTYSVLGKMPKDKTTAEEEKNNKSVEIKKCLEKDFGQHHPIFTLTELAWVIKSNTKHFPAISKSTQDEALNVLSFWKIISESCLQPTLHSQRNILLSQLMTTIISMFNIVRKEPGLMEPYKKLKHLSSKHKICKMTILDLLIKNDIDLLVKIKPKSLSIESITYPRHSSYIKSFGFYCKFPSVFPKTNAKNYEYIKNIIEKNSIYKLASTFGGNPTHYLRDLKIYGFIGRKKEKQNAKETKIYLEVPDDIDRLGVIRAYNYIICVEDYRLTLDDVLIPQKEASKIEELIDSFNETDAALPGFKCDERINPILEETVSSRTKRWRKRCADIYNKQQNKTPHKKITKKDIATQIMEEEKPLYNTISKLHPTKKQPSLGTYIKEIRINRIKAGKTNSY